MPAPRARTTPPTATEEAISHFARGTDQMAQLTKDGSRTAPPPVDADPKAPPPPPFDLSALDPPTVRAPVIAAQLAQAPILDAPKPSVRSEADVAAELRDLEDKLGRCIATLAMHFQPIVHADSRKRFGYEALMRSTDRALPHPGAILEAAERLEKLQPLGRAIRAQVAKVIATSPVERGMVCLNLHLLDLLDKQLTSSFAPLSKVASRVILEITERNSIEGQDVGIRVAELRELGFKIAIDDHGGSRRMGSYSPFETDFIKLDMTVVRGIDTDASKQRTVRSLAELCHNQGTQLIAEGVETEAEAKILAELGCDLLQGYLFARPALPFADPL